MGSKTDRDIVKEYPDVDFVAKLRGLGDSIENGERFEFLIKWTRK